jgi:hypothetical protein
VAKEATGGKRPANRVRKQWKEISRSIPTLRCLSCREDEEKRRISGRKRRRRIRYVSEKAVHIDHSILAVY